MQIHADSKGKVAVDLLLLLWTCCCGLWTKLLLDLLLLPSYIVILQKLEQP